MHDSPAAWHVDPGGPALRRVVDVDGVSVEICKLSVSTMDNNVYLLRDVAADRALLIDAADSAERILAEIGGTTVEAVITTHGHWDHHRALDVVAEATGATVIHHPADEPEMPRPADQLAEDGLRVPFGDVAVGLVHTPGHTRGSVCVLLGDRHLFSGDTLFPGGIGRTGSPEDFDTAYRYVTERLFTLDDDTQVHPGHGDATTLGAERPHLAEWRERGW